MVDKTGFEAPGYENGETKKITFQGRQTTIIAFFPGAFTDTCTKEMTAFRDNLNKFNQLGAQVIGISVDTPFALKEFAEQNNLDFTLVSDTDKQIIENYEVKTMIPDLEYEIATRAVFIIQKGEIVYSEVLDDPSTLPDMDTLENKLQELK
jgi:peroxiredoxin